MNPYRICSLGLVAVLAVACTGSKNPQRGGNVQRQDLVQKVSVTGSLRGKRSSYIYPAYSGYVTDLRVKLGDHVRESAPLVRIVQTADQPIAQVYPIQAPFSGKVTQVLKNAGEYVYATNSNSVENAILRLDDLSEYWVDVSIPEIDIAKIKVNQEVQIRPTAMNDVVYEGVVKEISLSSKTSADRWDRGKVEFGVLIQITKHDDKILPGMTAVADIIADKADQALVVPHEYVHRDGSRYYVVTVKGEQKDVTVGLANESLVQVLSGVEEGESLQMIDFSRAAKAPSGGSRGRRSNR